MIRGSALAPGREAKQTRGMEPPTSRPKVLARELGEFLLQFSIALHRFGIYPRDHPALVPLTASILGRLRVLLLERERLTLGVAQSQLVIEGVATDRRNPVLLELARRLHDHQIGAITFRREVDENALHWLLEALAVHPERRGEPEGLRPASERPSLSGIILHPLGYDLLSLQGGEEEAWRPEPTRATSLWMGLAQAAMATSREASVEASLPGPAPDPGDPPASGNGASPETPPAGGAEVALSLATHRRESAYEQVIVGYLLQIAEELRHGAGPEVDGVRRRMVEMVRELDEDTLERILRMGGDTARLRSFVLDSSEALNLDAVLKLLRAAASSTERNLSSPLTRVLTKLALHAEQGDEGVRDRAAGAFRETVEAVILDWDAEAKGETESEAEGRAPAFDRGGAISAATSPDYSLLLDTMARASPLFPAIPGEEGEGFEMEGPDGALRLIQTALEVNGDGPMVRRAVAALTAEGRVLEILRLTDAWAPDTWPPDTWPPSEAATNGCLAHRLREELATPGELARLLSGGERVAGERIAGDRIAGDRVTGDRAAEDRIARKLDPGAVAEMSERVGEAAIGPLLDALEGSESRTVRRRAFDALAGLGPRLAQGLAPRIPELGRDPRWYVRRNLLSLLRSAGEVPDGFSPLPFLRDPDVRVRKTALLLAVELSRKLTAMEEQGEMRAEARWEMRAEALRTALDDPEAGVVRSALLELQCGLPDSVVPRLVRGLLAASDADAERASELRPLALRALRGCPARPALDAALQVLDGGRTLLGRRKLPPASPEVREALGVALSPPWRGHPETSWIGPALELAAPRDPDYASWVRALEPGESGPG